ncbi:MAG TPA: RNA-binding cell elongation regulator Jag/EloR [Tissierellales bacterium]|nr:RNA-binding cell elongation regulator Jag/EloR [Tissierellales bacterium]
MRSVVKTAKTVEEAIREGLRELGADKDDVTTEILEEPSKGIFGFIGTKEAKVKITVVNDPVKIAKSFIDELLNKMDIEGTSMVKKEGSILHVEITDIVSSDTGIVIGRRGNTIDAIQYLLSLVVNKDRENYIKTIVDVKGYRERREETLIRLANKMARKAKSSNRPVKLEPMNPYERRIIHSALQDEENIKTYSEGKEPYRKIVIELR